MKSGNVLKNYRNLRITNLAETASAYLEFLRFKGIFFELFINSVYHYFSYFLSDNIKRIEARN